MRRHAQGRSLELTAAAVDAGELDPAALGAEADSLLVTDPATTDIGPGEYPVVLGAWAVAEVLRRAALAFGGPQSPHAGRLGSQVAAPAVNLSESPRFAATLPRSYDAQGVPRQPLPLIQDGIAHRFVGPDTGHAQAPGGVGGFFPEHLVLVGGGAARRPRRRHAAEALRCRDHRWRVYGIVGGIDARPRRPVRRGARRRRARLGRVEPMMRAKFSMGDISLFYTGNK